MKNFGSITLGLFASLNLHAVLIQDFETNTSGITPISSGLDEDNNSLTDAIFRSDGTGPDTFLPGANPSSSGGDWFGEVRMGYDKDTGFPGSPNIQFVAVQGDRAIWNDEPQTGAFVSGEGFQVDVLFEDTGFFGSGDGFFFQPTLLDNDNNFTPINGGGFAAQVIFDGTNVVWRVGADGNAKGFDSISGSFHDINEGWYTMETIWTENGSGGVDQANTLTEISSGTEVLSVVFTDVIVDVNDAGRIGAASFGNGDDSGATTSQIAAIAIDNVSIVPEPSAYAIILGAMGLSLAVSRRRR